MESYKVLIGEKLYEFFGVVETELLTTQIEDKKFVLGTKHELFTTCIYDNAPKMPNIFSKEKIKIYYKNQWHIAQWSFSKDPFEHKKALDMEMKGLENVKFPDFYLHLHWEIRNS